MGSRAAHLQSQFALVRIKISGVLVSSDEEARGYVLELDHVTIANDTAAVKGALFALNDFLSLILVSSMLPFVGSLEVE